MTFDTILIFIISLILLWIKPGPGQAFKLACLFNRGFLSALFVVFGVITACLVFFFIAVLGYGAVTNFFTQASDYLKIIGAIYLVYMGMKILKNTQKGVWKNPNKSVGKIKFWENYLAGILVTLANPLPIFYFLSLLPILVPIGELNTTHIVMGASLIVLVGLTVDGLLLVLGHQMREMLSNESLVRGVNIFTAVSFFLLALFLLYSLFFIKEFHFNILNVL